jgi:hypothetical protein
MEWWKFGKGIIRRRCVVFIVDNNVLQLKICRLGGGHLEACKCHILTNGNLVLTAVEVRIWY